MLLPVYQREFDCGKIPKTRMLSLGKICYCKIPDVFKNTNWNPKSRSIFQLSATETKCQMLRGRTDGIYGLCRNQVAFLLARSTFIHRRKAVAMRMPPRGVLSLKPNARAPPPGARHVDDIVLFGKSTCLVL